MSGRPIPYKQVVADLATVAAFGEYATGYRVPIPDQVSVIDVQPSGFGLWAMVRRTDMGISTWNGERWVTTTALAPEQIYRWTLAEVRAVVLDLAAKEGEEHAAWNAYREAQAQRATALAAAVDEFLEPVREAVAEAQGAVA